MDADFALISAFIDDDARVRYARRVAEQIALAMQGDTRLAEDAILRGRVGLAQMDDRQLLETGVEAWAVLPRPEELRPPLH